MTRNTWKETFFRTVLPPPSVTNRPQANPKNITEEEEDNRARKSRTQKYYLLQGRQRKKDRINTNLVPTTVMKLVKIGKIVMGLLCLLINYHLFPMCVIFVHRQPSYSFRWPRRQNRGGPRKRILRRKRTGKELWLKRRSSEWEWDLRREMQVPIDTIASFTSKITTEGEGFTTCWTVGRQKLEAEARHCYRNARWYAVCIKMSLWTHLPSKTAHVGVHNGVTVHRNRSRV